MTVQDGFFRFPDLQMTRKRRTLIARGGNGEMSVRAALLWPTILLAAMMLSAFALSLVTKVDGSHVFLPYVGAWASITLIAALIRLFIEVARLAPQRVDQPLRLAVQAVIAQRQLFILSAFIFPTFLGAYTWAKSSIPFIVGYPFEAVWADADRWLLGDDGWRITHAISPASLAVPWTYFYAMVWGFGLAFSGPIIAVFAGRRFATIFFTALMLSWLLGGVVLAYALSAAGPVFAHLADPSFADRFAPLRAELTNLLGAQNIVVRTQYVLAATLGDGVAIKGGGISAMPSMHIATATTLLLAARGTAWIYPAIAFLALTFFGSVYLGYHYVVDAPVAALVAVICWKIAEWLYQPSIRPLSTAAPPARLPERAV
jgi:hypothetical protein